MPRPDAPPVTRGVVFRWLGLAVAIALLAVAFWLIVTGDTPKRTQLGVLAGLWGALVGAFALFGSRRFLNPHEVTDASAGPPGAQPGAQPGAALELRSAATELERAEEAAARRAHEARLEHLLRREIQNAVAHEVSALREEIAGLRSELVEKVGGQLRLERIEITRVIGSDLEALQDDVRQLKQAAVQDPDEFAIPLSRGRAPEPLRQIVEPARVRPVTRETAEVEASVQPARQVPAAAPAPAAEPAPAPAPVDATAPIRMGAVPTPAAPSPLSPPSVAPAPAPAPAPPSFASTPDPPLPRLDPLPNLAGLPHLPPPATSVVGTAPPAPAPPPAATPVPAQPTAPAPAAPPPAPPAVPPPSPAAAAPVDDFAALPRIRPFTDFELDPIEDEPAYSGRRRRGDDPEPSLGRHSHRTDQPVSRRHRRADQNVEDDLLARLLAREGR